MIARQTSLVIVVSDVIPEIEHHIPRPARQEGGGRGELWAGTPLFLGFVPSSSSPPSGTSLFLDESETAIVMKPFWDESVFYLPLMTHQHREKHHSKRAPSTGSK